MMYRIQLVLKKFARAASTIHTHTNWMARDYSRTWMLLLVVVCYCNSLSQASELAEQDQTTIGSDYELLSRSDEAPQAAQTLPDCPLKEPDVVAYLSKHRQSVAAIQRRKFVVSEAYSRLTRVEKLQMLLPFTVERAVTFLKLIQLYLIIASLESQLIMSDWPQHAEPAAETLSVLSSESGRV